MKTCVRCGAQKLLADFYKNSGMASGYLNQCKDCTLQKQRQSIATNKAQRNAYEKQRRQRLDRKAKMLEYGAAYSARYPLKYKAHIVTGVAIRAGKLQRQPCLYCGASQTEAHHPDYSRPLEVVWLCPPCHRQHHVQERQKTR